MLHFSLNKNTEYVLLFENLEAKQLGNSSNSPRKERAARPGLRAVQGDRLREVRPDGGRLAGHRGDERQDGAGLPRAARGQQSKHRPHSCLNRHSSSNL